MYHHGQMFYQITLHLRKQSSKGCQHLWNRFLQLRRNLCANGRNLRKSTFHAACFEGICYRKQIFEQCICHGFYGCNRRHQHCTKLSHGAFQICTGTICRFQFCIIFSPSFCRLHQPLIGQFLQHQICPFTFGLCGFQFFIEVILTGTCPVQHVRKRTCYRSRFDRFIDGFRQAVNGNRVPVGCPCADCTICHLYQLFLR